MKDCYSRLPKLVAIGGVAVGVGLAFSGWPYSDGQTWAAWVQAVGSIGAILVAVWVAYDQHKKTGRRVVEERTTEVRNVLAGLRDELEVLWGLYMRQVGTAVEASLPGTIIPMWWPAPEDPFTVYKSVVGKIGCVENDTLRRSIIATYALASGLLLTFQAHNRFFDEGVAAMKRANEEPCAKNQNLQAEAVDEWISYDDQLRTQHSETKRSLDETLQLLSRALAQSKT
ncbi:hypothetical protein [Achromobacter xylosoxidans]|uniref:hypothetical protein n=1 Tax=Alcaligenes xylosoxydans xylosoxydans TaxID=85698 RepID=UPI0012904ED9|nr:hypothetical protein [Achromobacter xylosoxidans]